MPARDFHVNLTNRTFPHNFDELGSTIIAAEAQMEQNQRVSPGFSGEDAEQSIGICQAYFMQNVLPTSRGYSSVSFLQTLPPIPGLTGVPDSFYILRGASSASAVFVPTNQKQYIFDPTVGSWQEFDVDTLAPPVPTVAFLKQRSFVFYPTIGCFEYDFVEQEFVRVEFTGLNVGNILGICAAGAFLVAWDSTTVYWSSVNDPLDFTPSLSTGAGSSSILAIKGEIITCLPLGQDFVVYTATNAVGARQSGNVQLPFTFSEISGSEGIEKAEHVAYDTNQGVHITWTASGFQQVTLEQAGYAWPEFSDGVIRAIYSDYDENFNYPVLRTVDRLELKLNFISNRWVGVSIKDSADVTGSYTFAMIYDTTLQRWGRLDVLHKDLMEFTGPNISRSMTYAELAAEYPTYEDLLGIPYQTFAKNAVISSPRSGLNFGVCLSNGSVYRAALYQTEQKIETTNGIIAKPPRIILGKFKIFRTHGAMLHGFKVQRLEEGVQIRAHLHSYTGELVGYKVGFAENAKHAGHFLGRANADSFSLEFTGKFHLTDLVCSAADAGKRNQRSVALQEEVLCLRTKANECIKVTDGAAEFCVIVGGDPQTTGNVGSKYELRRLVDYADTLIKNEYTLPSWMVFEDALGEARNVLNDASASQAEIDGAVVVLDAAIAQLVIVDEVRLNLLESVSTQIASVATESGGVFSPAPPDVKYTIPEYEGAASISDILLWANSVKDQIFVADQMVDGQVYEISSSFYSTAFEYQKVMTFRMILKSGMEMYTSDNEVVAENAANIARLEVIFARLRIVATDSPLEITEYNYRGITYTADGQTIAEIQNPFLAFDVYGLPDVPVQYVSDSGYNFGTSDTISILPESGGGITHNIICVATKGYPIMMGEAKLNTVNIMEKWASRSGVETITVLCLKTKSFDQIELELQSEALFSVVAIGVKAETGCHHRSVVGISTSAVSTFTLPGYDGFHIAAVGQRAASTTQSISGVGFTQIASASGNILRVAYKEQGGDGDQVNYNSNLSINRRIVYNGLTLAGRPPGTEYPPVDEGFSVEL